MLQLEKPPQAASTAQFLSVRELAQLLKVHYSTVMRLIMRKRLKAVRVGRLWRVSVESYEQFLADGGCDDE